MKARLAASAALALGIAIGASGCGLLTYQATTEEYDPSDGVSADVGALDLRNVLVVSEDGIDGNLVMTVVNTGAEDVELNVQLVDGGETQTIEVGAGESVALGTEDEDPLLFEDIDSDPGSLLPMYFQYDGAEGRELSVPVLDGRLPEYEDLVP